MPASTVLLAPSGVADGVLGVLTDLSAAGLVGPFIWITDPSDAAPPQVLTRVEGGRSADVTLQQIVTAHNIDVMRVCVIVPMVGFDTPLTLGQERFIADLLASSTGASHTVRVRALLARPGMSAPAGVKVAVDGWHNLLIAPEDRPGPGLGHVRLAADDAAAEIGRYAAPVLAGALGLWSDLDHAPLDHSPVMPGEVVRMTRSFYRKLDTAQAESGLRRQLLSQDGTLPLPSDQRAQVVYVTDVSLAATTMADKFWQKHAAVLKGPRRTYERAPAAQKIGLGAALKLFFGFMWAAIKNAPAAWYAAMVNSVSTGIAATMNKTIFGGAESAYEVVINGRTARGERAEWSDIASASSQLSGVLAGQPDGGQHSARSDLSAVWQDYSRAAMTLADAGVRSAELPPVQIGVNRGIIGRAAEVVPGPSEKFTDIPGIIAANVEVDSLDATDPLGLMSLRHKLTDLERTPEHGLQARETLNNLEAWQRRYATSFGVVVGRRLADAFASVYGEVQKLLQKLSNAPELPPEPDASNKKLARWIQFTLILMLLVTAAVVYFAVAGHLKWLYAVVIALATYLISLILCVRAFIHNQRELFQLLNRRKAILDERAVDEENLRTALRDLNRLSQGYGEYLAWSRALGAFLAAPLGPDTQYSQDALRLSWGLPLSTAVGYAAPADTDLATTVGYLRRDLFNLGWLSGAWEHLVVTALPSPPGSRELTADSSPLWIHSGRGSGSVLDAWSSALFSGSVTSTGADVTWRRALQNLTGSMAQLIDSLVSHVQQPGGSTVARAEFLAEIDRPAPPPSTYRFDSSLLTDVAITHGAAAVMADERDVNKAGVGIVCVATQFSDAIPVDYIKSGPDGAPASWSAPMPAAPRESLRQQNGDVTGPGQPYIPPEPGGGFKF
ncbi:hypothetical protein ACGFK1_04720 [Mycobacterium sp. NPDC048908]|uniref:hypothetical protein n=1 Tax=Mycobacterium sp. NPDC048908 TaxID=3364292 RepID=UPI0037201648